MAKVGKRYLKTVQARGGRLVGDERAHTDRDCGRAGDHSDDAAALPFVQARFGDNIRLAIAAIACDESE